MRFHWTRGGSRGYSVRVVSPVKMASETCKSQQIDFHSDLLLFIHSECDLITSGPRAIPQRRGSGSGIVHEDPEVRLHLRCFLLFRSVESDL